MSEKYTLDGENCAFPSHSQVGFVSRWEGETLSPKPMGWDQFWAGTTWVVKCSLGSSRCGSRRCTAL